MLRWPDCLTGASAKTLHRVAESEVDLDARDEHRENLPPRCESTRMLAAAAFSLRVFSVDIPAAKRAG